VTAPDVRSVCRLTVSAPVIFRRPAWIAHGAIPCNQTAWVLNRCTRNSVGIGGRVIMFKPFRTVALLGLFTAACGGSSTAPTNPGPAVAVTGTWSGTATDSTTAALGAGGMMGQAGMGAMTWQLTQNGSNVAGTMGFSGMSSSGMRGTLSGTMSGEDMTFTMDLPVGSMMSSTCSAHSTGTAHMDGAAMTMTGGYSGTNSCTGSFTGGQLTMSRR
jgi:hypothetical protein